MKKHMKKLTAVLMAVAMTLSLSVSAFASVVSGDYSDTTSTVISEGGLPTDRTTVVLPTSSSGQFNMIFDSHGLIKETDAVRLGKPNYGESLTDADIDDARFFFENTTQTAVDVKDETSTPYVPFKTGKDYGTDPNVVPKGTEVVKFAKATIGKIYAKNVGEDNFEWVKLVPGVSASVASVESGDWVAGAAYEKISALEDKDPTLGENMDAIAALNKSDPNLYLKKGDAIDTAEKATAAGHADLLDTIEYTFVSALGTTVATDFCYIYFKDGTATNFFKTLGDNSNDPTVVTGATATGLADFSDGDATTADVDDAVLTVTDSGVTTVYYRVRTNQTLKSFRATSNQVKVINKTNAAIGVMMSAELENLPAGDGKKDSSGKQTYVYAKDISVSSGDTIFYDGPSTDTNRNKIVGGNDGVPVFYFALTNGTDTEVLSYNSTSGKSTVTLGAALAGRPEYFEKSHDGSSYQYLLKDEHKYKREADFHAMTFNFVGAIDADNDVWNSFATAPTVKVTWSIEAMKALTAPTITKPATIKSSADATFTISDNTDKLVVVSVTQDGEEIPAAKIFVTNDDTTGATTQVRFTKGTVTGTKDLVFTFQDQNKAFLTKDVTVSYT